MHTWGAIVAAARSTIGPNNRGVADECADLLHESAIARPHRPLDAGRAGRALRHGVAGLRHVDEGARLSGDQPDGQGAGAA